MSSAGARARSAQQGARERGRRRVGSRGRCGGWRSCLARASGSARRSSAASGRRARGALRRSRCSARRARGCGASASPASCAAPLWRAQGAWPCTRLSRRRAAARSPRRAAPAAPQRPPPPRPAPHPPCRPAGRPQACSARVPPPGRLAGAVFPHQQASQASRLGIRRHRRPPGRSFPTQRAAPGHSSRAPGARRHRASKAGRSATGTAAAAPSRSSAQAGIRSAPSTISTGGVVLHDIVCTRNGQLKPRAGGDPDRGG